MADYDNVTALWEQSGLDYRPDGRDGRESIGREAGNGRSLLLVAEAEGRLVGVVIGTHDGRKGWINRLAVHPASRRGRAASLLVAAAEDWLAAAGIDVVACLIERANEVSRRVFERLGYSEARNIAYFAKRQRPEA